tara:strand:- start:211 stop:837 length:627 start_codon:yes stop_codon:yes gene_type:complete
MDKGIGMPGSLLLHLSSWYRSFDFNLFTTQHVSFQQHLFHNFRRWKDYKSKTPTSTRYSIKHESCIGVFTIFGKIFADLIVVDVLWYTTHKYFFSPIFCFLRTTGTTTLMAHGRTILAVFESASIRDGGCLLPACHRSSHVYFSVPYQNVTVQDTGNVFFPAKSDKTKTSGFTRHFIFDNGNTRKFTMRGKAAVHFFFAGFERYATHK